MASNERMSFFTGWALLCRLQPHSVGHFDAKRVVRSVGELFQEAGPRNRPDRHSNCNFGLPDKCITDMLTIAVFLGRAGNVPDLAYSVKIFEPFSRAIPASRGICGPEPALFADSGIRLQ